jgi:flagellar hook-associated protein 3 FlgL
MRTTMTSIMRQYNSRLSTSLERVNRAAQRALTGRKFEKAAENPAAAVRSLQLQRQYNQNENYLTNLRDVQGLFDVAESAMTKISKSAEEVYTSVLSALNGDKSPDEHKLFASQLRTIQQTMVMDANSSYSDQYMFGGSSTKDLPFVLSSDGKTLFYRGIDVNSSDPNDILMLEALSEEHLYVDFGFGLKFDSSAAQPNTLLPGSAFDTSLPGINFLGFGLDASSGLSNNIITTVGQLADALEEQPINKSKITNIADQFEKQRNELLINITQMGTNTIFMNFTVNRLEDAQYNLTLRMRDTEYIDTALAYSEYEIEKYAYEAALRIGTSILSPSFIDFMR